MSVAASGGWPQGDWADLDLSEAEYRRAARRYRLRRSLRAYAFLAPYFIPFVLFLAVPAIWAIGLSFFQGGIVEDARFVGLGNWKRVAADGELRESALNTFYFVVIAVTLVFALAMGLAILLDRYRRGSSFFKLGLYFPLLAPLVLGGLIWQFLVHYDFGVLNLLMRSFGFERLNFLGDPTLALLTIVAVEVWRGLGFWTLYFLAGIQGVPQELLDAARVDGARGYRRFFRVTLPMLRPLLLFAVVIAIIYNFQVFDTVFVMTQGGPALATSTIVWFIYRSLFAFQDTGLAYAASVGLLFIILGLTLVSFRFLGGKRRRRRRGRTA